MATIRPPTGHVFRVERARGPVWYAKYRLPDGRQVQKKVGPAWDRDPSLCTDLQVVVFVTTVATLDARRALRTLREEAKDPTSRRLAVP